MSDGELADVFENATDWTERVGEVAYGPAHQSFSGRGMPKDGETYVMRFDESQSVVAHPLVQRAARAAVLVMMSVRAYRMREGHGLRIHSDAYLGEVAATIYPNRSWSWDWGGLLHVLSPDGVTCKTFLPVSQDKPVVVFHRTAHFVSPVAPWAKQPRYVLAVFGLALPSSLTEPR